MPGDHLPAAQAGQEAAEGSRPPAAQASQAAVESSPRQLTCPWLPGLAEVHEREGLPTELPLMCTGCWSACFQRPQPCFSKLRKQCLEVLQAARKGSRRPA